MLVVNVLRKIPVRLVLIVVWVIYVVIIFSNCGILPGTNALRWQTGKFQEGTRESPCRQ